MCVAGGSALGKSFASLPLGARGRVWGNSDERANLNFPTPLPTKYSMPCPFGPNIQRSPPFLSPELEDSGMWALERVLATHCLKGTLPSLCGSLSSLPSPVNL